ncbi:MAG: hypothetical protein ACOC7U_00315 [Spirochaetota bacterium]
MRFVFRSIIKIIVFFLIVLIPVALFITIFSLNQREIPLWNIGIRNIFIQAQNYTLHTVVISYLISVLLYVSLVDKIKVKSIVMLHIPPILAGALLMGGGYFLHQPQGPFKIKKDMRIGYLTFLKEKTFNTAGNRLVYLVPEAKDNPYTVCLYERPENKLHIIEHLHITETGNNYLQVDKAKKLIAITYTKHGQKNHVNIPFEALHTSDDITTNPLLLMYRNLLTQLTSTLKQKLGGLGISRMFVFASSMLLSVLLVSIPLTYLLNDGGWRFSGLAGMVLVLAALPLFYSVVFKLLGNIRLDTSFLGEYYYLFAPVVFSCIGVCISIAVKTKRKSYR